MHESANFASAAERADDAASLLDQSVFPDAVGVEVGDVGTGVTVPVVRGDLFGASSPGHRAEQFEASRMDGCAGLALASSQVRSPSVLSALRRMTPMRGSALKIIGNPGCRFLVTVLAVSKGTRDSCNDDP